MGIVSYLYIMEKEYVIKAWDLIKDTMNPGNRTRVFFAIDDLFHQIEIDGINCLKDYIQFKDKWYSVLKNK